MANGLRNSIENMYKKNDLVFDWNSINNNYHRYCFIISSRIKWKSTWYNCWYHFFLIEGINSIYKYFHREGAKLYNLNLVFGVIYAVLGVVIILVPSSVVEFITICLGIYMIVNGASKVNYALWLKRGNEDSWLITLATGILVAIVGVLVIFNPFASLTLTKLAGAFLIITGILDFMDTILFKNRSKEIMEIFW